MKIVPKSHKKALSGLVFYIGSVNTPPQYLVVKHKFLAYILCFSVDTRTPLCYTLYVSGSAVIIERRREVNEQLYCY